jgi:hypothetical protein
MTAEPDETEAWESEAADSMLVALADFIATCKSPGQLGAEALALLAAYLSDRGVKLQ